MSSNQGPNLPAAELPRLAKDTAWTTLALGSRMGLQAVYYVMLARTLGAEGLGIFSAAIAFVNLLVPFSGWGGGRLIVQYVARDRSVLPVYYRNAVRLLATSGVFFAALAVTAGTLLLGRQVHHLLLLIVALSELLVLPFVETVIRTFQAIDRMDLMARVQISIGLLRVAAVAVYGALVSHASITTFAGCYFVAALATAAAARWALFRHVGPLQKVSRPKGLMARSIREGLPFSLSAASTSVYVDIDKVMLTRMVSADVTGVYTAAYRLIAMAFTPVQSAVMAANTRLFKEGAGGILPARRFAMRLLPYLIFYALLVGVMEFIFAPLLPLLLGPGFRQSVTILRWLVLLPAIQSVHNLLGDTLMGAGHQAWRCACQILVAGVNVGLNLWLIPRFSWKGAVVSTFAAEGTLAACMVALLIWHSGQAQRASEPPGLEPAGFSDAPSEGPLLTKEEVA